MRVLLAGAAGLLGLLLGTAATLALRVPPAVTLGGRPPTSSTTAAPTTPVPQPPGKVLLVWTPGSLPDALGDRVGRLEGVEAITEVRADLVHLTAWRNPSGTELGRAPDGYLVPLEAVGVDPPTYAPFLPESAREAVTRLRPDEVILGSTSARVRHLGRGGIIELADGRRLRVAEVLDDTLVGAAELLTAHPDALSVASPRYLLVRHTGPRATVEAAIRRLLPAGVPARIRGPGETPFFRHGDAVLPQAHIKEAFGEFAYRPGPGRSIEQDPSWVEANLVTERLPLLGEQTCHRGFMPAVRGALEQLEVEGLAHLVASSAGCWNPRLIAPGRGVSRHAWGAAIDLNYGENPTGVASAQDPRLVEVMERWGLGWGGFWLVPDPAHFEYVRHPAP